MAWGINSVNGMSAMSNLFGLYYALFAVSMCNYLIVFWIVDSHDIDQSKDVKSLPFRVSELYAYCRSEILDFNRLYFYIILAALYPIVLDLICTYEKEYSGSIDIEGKSQGFFMLGITSMFVVIFVHHIWLLMYTKQF